MPRYCNLIQPLAKASVTSSDWLLFASVSAQAKMGKKRVKDKSSREDDDIDLSGKYIIILMFYDNLLEAEVDFYIPWLIF